MKRLLVVQSLHFQSMRGLKKFMSYIAIWIDHKNANIFDLSENPAKKASLQVNQLVHHTHRLDHFDQNRWDRKLYQQIIDDISKAEKILILGPGVAKFHFQNYMTEHYPYIAKKVVGCETVDHPTDPQIIALSKKLFE